MQHTVYTYIAQMHVRYVFLFILLIIAEFKAPCFSYKQGWVFEGLVAEILQGEQHRAAVGSQVSKFGHALVHVQVMRNM